MKTIIPALLLLVVGVGKAAETCAVKVILTDAKGSPTSALVELLDASGQVVDRSMGEDGKVEFCDFDFGDHSIHVGGTTCGAVVVPHVRAQYNVSQVFRVYVNDCIGVESLQIGCGYYFRVASTGQTKLSSVSLTSRPPGISKTTDQYGRIRISLAVGERRTLVFQKDGYAPLEYRAECKSPEYHEERIRLLPMP